MDFENKKIFSYLIKYSLNNTYNNNELFIKLLLTKVYEKSRIYNFLSDINMIGKNYILDELNSIKLLYFNRKSIHDILYEKEKEIFINVESKNISFYFYLSLLIRDQPTRTNYYYSFDFIKKITNSINNKSDNLYYKLLMSKIILELIDNYEQRDDNDSNNDINNDINKIEINKMKYYYNKIIEENIKYINNELDLNWNKKYIINKSIDKLYKDIIEKLLLNNKLEEYDYIYNII